MDLARLQPVYGHPGPYLTVTINVSRNAEDTDKAIQVRWDNARKELADQGAGEHTLQALDEVVGRDDHRGGTRGQILFATGGEVVFDALVADPPQDYTARVAPLPDPMPLLAHRTPNVPYVLSLVDSVGADLTSVDARGRRHHSKVDGDDFPTHKPRGGTGSEQEKQIQNAVDEQLKANHKQVAAEVQRLAAAGEAELVIVAGDPGPQQTLLEMLHDRPQIAIVKAENGHRAAGFDDDSLQQELAAHLRDHLERRRQTVVDRFEHERGIGERATEGLSPVVEALREGLVETLLWNPEGDEQAVYIGPRPEHLGLTEQELHDLDVAEPHRVDLGSALVRAAAGLGSGVQFVSGDAVKLHDDIGALLRGTNPSLPS